MPDDRTVLFTAPFPVGKYRGRRWAQRMDRHQQRLARSVQYSLFKGLNGFGPPTIGGQNAWRYFGYIIDHANQNVLYREVGLQIPIKQALLGVGAALAHFNGTRDLQRKTELAAGYGFLEGVSEGIRRSQRGLRR